MVNILPNKEHKQIRLSNNRIKREQNCRQDVPLNSLKFCLYCTLYLCTSFCNCPSKVSYSFTSSSSPPFPSPPKFARSTRSFSILIFNPLIDALASFTFNPAKKENEEEKTKIKQVSFLCSETTHNTQQASQARYFLTHFFSQIIARAKQCFVFFNCTVMVVTLTK